MDKYLLDISRSAVRNRLPLVKYGSISSTTGAAFEDVWPIGGTKTYLTTASTIRIKAGGNAADTAAGVGAQAVFISGVDEDYVPISDVLVSAGASASTATTNTYLRVDRAYVTDVGATGWNTAAIIIEAVTGGSTQAVIATAEGQTQQCAFTVPVGHTAYLIGVAYSLVDTVGAGTLQHLGHFRLRSREYLTTSTNNLASWRTRLDIGGDTDGTCAGFIDRPIATGFPAKSDVVMQLFTHAAAAGANATLFVIYVLD